MKTKVIIIMILLLGAFAGVSMAQSGNEGKKQGEITYKSAKNIYVRFESTEGITPGDTLFVEQNGEMIPALRVDNLSSISCVCTPLADLGLSKETRVWSLPASLEIAPVTESGRGEASVTPENEEEILAEEKKEISALEEQEKKEDRISGRISVSSYSDFSNAEAEDHQRMRYVFSLDADKIGGSGLSFESYINFSHRNNNWDEIQHNIYRGLKIYNLSLNYEFNPEMNIWFGRRINPRVSSLGAADGVQFEKKFNNLTSGVLIGSRPDWSDYSFNTDLFQAAVYLSHEIAGKKARTQNTIALVDQENKWNTDRRFVYLQHTSRLFRKLYLFGSGEFDIYKNVNGKAESNLDLTNLYIRLRYRVIPKLSMNLSYSARNNIILYETYKSFVEELLERETMQGFTFGLNARPFRNIGIGARAGYRDRGGDVRPSKNLYTYLSFTRLPFMKLSATLNAILLETSYMKGQVYGLRIYRDLMKGKAYVSVGYRNIRYTYYQNEYKQLQDIAEFSMNFRLPWKLYASLNYEGTFDKEFNFNRIYVNLTRRF